MQFFLAVQDSSIDDLVSQSDFWFQRYNDYSDSNHYNHYDHYNHYNHYNEYRDSDLDLDSDWERFSELVTHLTFTDKVRNLNHDIGG